MREWLPVLTEMSSFFMHNLVIQTQPNSISKGGAVFFTFTAMFIEKEQSV